MESYALVATFPQKGKATDSCCQFWRPHLTARVLTAAYCKAVACPPARTAGGRQCTWLNGEHLSRHHGGRCLGQHMWEFPVIAHFRRNQGLPGLKASELLCISALRASGRGEAIKCLP